MDLMQYDRAKLTIAEILRSATMRADGVSPAARDQFARLAQDRFNLVMVGRFSRGKTSLMNAMLGTDRLPTGIVPVTSVITTVTYGSEEKVVLYYRHTGLFLEIPMSQLAEHITERGNPGNRRGIRIAEVEMPAELLRRGFHFIDTPGLGSSIVENTRTTESFLPEADAFVLVTSYDGFLSEDEWRLLQTVHESGRRVFIVVNKQDCVAPEQRQQVLGHLSDQLAGLFGSTPPALFSVSALQALTAKLHGDTAELATSGLPAFEAALLDFLVNQRRRTFLLNMCDRVAAILHGQAGADQDLARLNALRSEIEAIATAEVAADLAAPVTAPISPLLPACEVCVQISQALFDFMAKYQYQLHGDAAVQADLAARGGLCSPHTWQLEAISAPQDICTGFAGVVERQARHLRALAQKVRNGALACQAVEAALPNAETCVACAVARRAEAFAVSRAAERLARDSGEALRNLSAICLPHLGTLAAAIGRTELVQGVLVREADLLDRLSEDMRYFALKRDGLQRHRTSKEEDTAKERSLRVLVGHPIAQMGPPAMRP